MRLEEFSGPIGLFFGGAVHLPNIFCISFRVMLFFLDRRCCFVELKIFRHVPLVFKVTIVVLPVATGRHGFHRGAYFRAVFRRLSSSSIFAMTSGRRRVCQRAHDGLKVPFFGNAANIGLLFRLLKSTW